MKATLNKPAVMAFLDGENAKGLEIRVFDDGLRVAFKAIKTLDGHDTVPLMFKERGGAEVVFDGTQIDTVISALRHPVHNPFFILRRIENGWMIAEPFVDKRNNRSKKMQEPQRFVPHLRVWPGQNGDGISYYGGACVTELVSELRDATLLVSNYNSNGTRGRPPQNVTEAREKLALFASAAKEFLPIYDDIRNMHSLLTRALSPRNGLLSFNEASVPPEEEEVFASYAEDIYVPSARSTKRRSSMA